MLKSVCVLFPALLVAPLSSAEIFKCVGKNGEALCQNFPCQFEWMDGMPTDVPALKKSPTEVFGPKKLPIVPAEPRVGMTTDEVRGIWGEPTDTIQEQPRDGSPLRSSRTAPLDLCALIGKGAWPPFSNREVPGSRTYNALDERTIGSIAML